MMRAKIVRLATLAATLRPRALVGTSRIFGMLPLAKPEPPFDYTLETLTDVVPLRRRVDLVETFDPLIKALIEEEERR